VNPQALGLEAEAFELAAQGMELHAESATGALPTDRLVLLKLQRRF
jgi:hypothetical protein